MVEDRYSVAYIDRALATWESVKTYWKLDVLLEEENNEVSTL